MKNKIVLVNPGIHFQKPVNYGIYPNTAIMVLTTILHNAGFCVKIVDGKYYNIDESVKLTLDEVDDDLVFIGFSVMTVQLSWAYYVSQAVKKARPSVKIVWGGAHPMLFPEQTVEDDSVDIVSADDSADTISTLASRLAQGSDLEGIAGIFYKNKKQILKTSLESKKDDFSSVPFIDFSLIDHEIYSRNNSVAMEEFYGGKYKAARNYPIITGLGCSYRCTFCINVILKRTYRYREAPEIIDRIKFLKSNYGADFIQPMDENFFINRRRTFEFLDLLEKEKLNINWRPQTRADYFTDNYINEEVAKRMDRLGMVVAAIGVESASQEILDKLQKNLKVEQTIKAAEILSKTNIVPKMNFMVGLPGETKEDVRKTYKLAVKLRKMIKKSCVTISPFRPYPGSQLYDEIVNKYGYTPPSSLKEWARISRKELIESDGYESFEKYKWIEDPGSFRKMLYVYNNIAWYDPNLNNTLKGKLQSWVSFKRFDLNFFSFIWLEKKLLAFLSWIKRLTVIIKGKFCNA